ncbi:MAG: sigma factor-like helix-turn-helix DNA-binding protein [Candidatus Bathyarchaeota archaeon]|nr:sigma factor-like helix-turn-helix DNA-binding protein [Candidatus Bathyarchaeota archaeon]
MFQIADYKIDIDGVLRDVPKRTKDVVSRRFGIRKKKNETNKETLESIGKDYGITRERIRQIEKKGIETLRRSPKFSQLEGALLKIKYFIDENGGLKREDILGSNLAPEEQYRSYLLLLLELGDMFSYMYDTPIFYSFWKTQEEAEKIAQKINGLFVDILKKERKLFPENEIVELGKQEAQKEFKKNFKENYILSYIEVSKIIEKNPFGEYGLSSWPEVSPKGVKTKAYLVLKKEGRPVHFQELSEMIEEKLNSPVHVNTLHNELIKDPSFVLVGRGIYGLKEWGYTQGTVKEIIEGVLKQEGELSKEEIIQKVQDQRFVKDSTIILNLGDFNKTKEGKYTI